MEHRGQCIAVVSGKGGTGKTSFAAGVGAALALSGRRVLCLDCDIGLRNLDIALAMTDRAVMDFTDVLAGYCSLGDAITPIPCKKTSISLPPPPGWRACGWTARPSALCWRKSAAALTTA